MRVFLIISASFFLIGAVANLAYTVHRTDPVAVSRDLSAQVIAQRDLASHGYVVVALDPQPALPCDAGTTAFEFTAVRDHHLIGGGICAGIDTTAPVGASRIVALPPLR